jgi:hypothetical protein
MHTSSMKQQQQPQQQQQENKHSLFKCTALVHGGFLHRAAEFHQNEATSKHMFAPAYLAALQSALLLRSISSYWTPTAADPCLHELPSTHLQLTAPPHPSHARYCTADVQLI